MSAGFGEFDATCRDGREHRWQSAYAPDRCCEDCGVLAAEFFAGATEARTEFFSTLRAPDSAHGKKKAGG